MQIAHPSPILGKTKIKRASSSVSPAFSPEQIANGGAFWLADDAALVDWSSGAHWYDRVAAKELAQPTINKMPTYNAASAIAGKPALDFDGVNDLLRFNGALSGVSSGSVFMLLRADATILQVPWSASSEAAQVFYLMGGIGFPSNEIFIEQRNNDPDSLVYSNTLVGGVSILIEWQSLDTTYAIAFNGIDQAKHLYGSPGGLDNGDWFADTTLVDNFVVGAWKNNVSENSWFNGLVAFVLVVNGALSAPNRQAFNDWVETTYGITMP